MPTATAPPVVVKNSKPCLMVGGYLVSRRTTGNCLSSTTLLEYTLHHSCSQVDPLNTELDNSKLSTEGEVPMND
jgi:hypothetical protein